MVNNKCSKGLRAGIAKTVISTTMEGVRVNDPLYAKVIIFDDGKTTIAIIAMDAVAIGGICDISDNFLQEIRSQIKRDFDIDSKNVMINASHTHTVAPMLCEEYLLIEKILDAIRSAIDNMIDVKVGTGIGYEDRFVINRSLRLKNGLHWTIRHANPCPPDSEVSYLGPIDPDIGILRVDSLDGQPFAVIYTYSCHPLIGVPNGSVTANFPGFASKVIENNLGAMAFFLQGTCGDVAEVLYKDFTRPMDSEPVGIILGLSTLKAFKGIKTGGAAISVACDIIELPRRTDIPRRIESLKQEQTLFLESLKSTSLNFRSFLPLYIKYSLNPDYPSDYSYRYLHAEQIGSDELKALDSQNVKRIEKYINNIYAMEKLARIQDKIDTLKKHFKINLDSGEDTIKAEVQGIKIGDFVMVTAPTETLVEVGLNVKKTSPYKYTFVISPSNGYMHYGAPESYYDKGGYEVTECLLGPGWQKLYEEKAREIINQL